MSIFCIAAITVLPGCGKTKQTKKIEKAKKANKKTKEIIEADLS